jgi:hypothetical protein
MGMPHLLKPLIVKWGTARQQFIAANGERILI